MASNNRAIGLGLTILIAALANSALAAARLILPIIALGMGATGVFVGIMSALSSASPMLWSVGFGRWVDRAGTRRPLFLALTLIAVAAVPFFLSPGLPTLVPLAALVGTGAIFAHVAALRAVTASSAAAERTRNLGYLVFCYSLFQFVGPMIASLGFERFGAAAGVAAISGLAMLALLAACFPGHGYRHVPAASADQTGAAGIATLVAIRSLRVWIIVSSVFSTAQVLFPFLLSLYSVDTGLSAPEAGIALGGFALGTAAARLATGFACRHLTTRSIATGSLLAAAAAYASMPLVSGLHLVLPLSVALGLSLGMGVPIALTPIYDEAPEGRVNEAVGLSMTLNTLLQTATPLVFGVTATWFGVTALFWSIGLILIAAAAFGWVALRSGRPVR